MKSKRITQSLGLFFCVLIAVLIWNIIFPATRQVSEKSSLQALIGKVSDLDERETDKDETPRSSRSSSEQMRESESARRKSTEIISSTNEINQDPDEVFFKKIQNMPLERANLNVRLEVENRIKMSEKERAVLIKSEKKNDKNIIAYAIKQPSMAEIKSMLSLYQKFLDRQTDVGAKKYIDERFGHIVDSYALMDGQYRLLYTVIPDGLGGDILQYSYPASSEQDCINILSEELAVKAPPPIGVPVVSRSGQSSLSRMITPGQWRMDHLVSEDLLKPYYSSTYRAQSGMH